MQENPAAATTNTESTTKEALIQSYQLYWRKQRGLSPSHDKEDVGEGSDENSDNSEEGKVTKSGLLGMVDGQEKKVSDMGAKLREQFKDEKTLLLESRKVAIREKKEQNKQETQEWLGEEGKKFKRDY